MRRSAGAWVHIEVQTPNREFDVRQHCHMTHDEGQDDCEPIEWFIKRRGRAGIWRPVKHKPLEAKLSEMIEEKSNGMDFSLEIHEAMSDGAEAAWEASQDR